MASQASFIPKKNDTTVSDYFMDLQKGTDRLAGQKADEHMRDVLTEATKNL